MSQTMTHIAVKQSVPGQLDNCTTGQLCTKPGLRTDFRLSMWLLRYYAGTGLVNWHCWLAAVTFQVVATGATALRKCSQLPVGYL